MPGFSQKPYDPFTLNDTTSPPGFQPPPPTRRPPPVPVPVQQPGMTISSFSQRPLEMPTTADMVSPEFSQASSRNNSDPMQDRNNSVAQSIAETNGSNEAGGKSPGLFASIMGRAPRMTKSRPFRLFSHPMETRANEGTDGKQQKKRGPKTDSKPALNSKQEKNRQAQRNHRERVAAYTMTVEKEANRARDALRVAEDALRLANNENSALAEDIRKLTHQNDVLTQLLRVNNIGVPNFSATPLSNSQQGSARINGSRAPTEAPRSSNHQQGSPYRDIPNSSQNTLGGFSPNGRGLASGSPEYPYVHGGIMHDVGAQQNGFSGGPHTSSSSGNNPYAQEFAGSQVNYANESAFAGTPYANTNYDSPYASTNHNGSQTHVSANQFEAQSMPQQSHAFTQSHAHATPAPSTQMPYGNASSPYANLNYQSSPEDSQVNQFQAQSMQMPPPNGLGDYQPYPAMNITIQSPYFDDSTDQQTPILEVAPHGPISFINVSKYEASHPAEVAQWRLLTPDIDEPEMTREFAIPFILDLEAGCRDHVAFMINRSNDASANPNPTSHNEYNHNGHGLMVSSTHWHSLVSSGSNPSAAPAMDQSDLNFIESLINSADQIPLRGEMTPVQAWTWMKQQRGRADWLCNEDWEKVWKILKDACRCYGFGAVVEKYEVENAMHEVYCARHPEMNREWE
ncbi:MAG: hypothetical protein Q9161_002585 [Pseudevernia consocians]